MLEGILVIMLILLWFIWRQLEQIAIALRKLYTEATTRRLHEDYLDE